MLELYDVGTRVVAIKDANKDVVNIYGFGTYEGNHVPPAWEEEMRSKLPNIRAVGEELYELSLEEHLARKKELVEAVGGEFDEEYEIQEYHALRKEVEEARGYTDEEMLEAILSSPIYENPKITLDSGEVVWGYECWWKPLENDEEWEAYLDGREERVVSL